MHCCFALLLFGSSCIFYLTNIHNNKHRSALIKLRLRNHRLRVETGSWKGSAAVVYNERKCQLCNMNQLEDEYHFVMSCSLYTELRQKYISSYFRTRPNMYKFVSLITTENVQMLTKLAIFVYKAFDKRKATEMI